MRISLMNAIVVVTTTAIALSAADNSIGTWKRNNQRTKYSPPPPNPFKSQSMTREAAADGGVKVTSKGVRVDGTPVETTYTLKYDGKSVPVSGKGSNFDSISAKQIDANTFTTETRKTGGKYHTTGKTVISSDGKTMTNASKGTDAEGKPISFVIIYDKQ
jgi:hypothetical protein